MEVGVLGFGFIPQTSLQDLSCTEVRRELGIHSCFQVPQGHSGRDVQNLEMEFGVVEWVPTTSG